MGRLRSWAGLGGTLLVACASLLTGCATNGPVSASGRPISPAVLAAAEQRVTTEQVPAELRNDYLALYAEGRENQALYSVRLGLDALRTGHKDLAKRAFDDAIQDVESLQAGASQAQRAQGKFVREQEKWFKGESYERAALYLYRGLLYFADQDFGNAAACFKRAEIQDITGEDAKDFAGDWYSAEWALAFASLKHGYPADAHQAFQRAEKFSTRQGPVPPPQAADNVLVVVEVGRGPQKYRSGEYGERLRFNEYVPRIQRVAIVQDNHELVRAAAAENLYVQATTRGTRQVDYVLEGKAAFKEGTGVAAGFLGTGALIAAGQHSREGNIAAGVLGGLALISAVTSAATTPQADIRAWDNLPHSIYLMSFKLPPGPAAFEVRGLGPADATVAKLVIQTETKQHQGVQVVFVRL